MATMADLFNKAPYVKLQQPGDAIVGVIVGEPDAEVPVYDFTTKKQKFFVELSPGTWKVLPEGQFNKETTNHRPVYKIVVTVRDENDKLWRVDFNTKQERESLKLAMQETGLPLSDGITLGKKCTHREGNMKTMAVRLIDTRGE